MIAGAAGPRHQLADALEDAAAGRFPAVDGRFDVLPPDPAGTWAVVEMTGHAFVLGDVAAADLTELGADGFGGAGHPDVLRLLAGPDGWIGCHDVVLARRTGSDDVEPLPVRDDLDGHPRVVRARHHREGVVVLGDRTGLVVVGRGLVGRIELAVELTDPATGGGGAGRRLVLGALATLEPGEWCFAQVSPGNAASLRTFLACGFTPIGAEVLILPSAGAGPEAPPR